MSFLRFEKILEISKIFKRAKNSTSTRYLQESLSSRNFRKISYLLRFKSHPRNSKFVPTKENEGKNAGCIDIGMFFFHIDSITTPSTLISCLMTRDRLISFMIPFFLILRLATRRRTPLRFLI